MKTKKNPKFDLEPQRKTFFFIGLVISLTIILLAFKSASEVEAIEIPVSNTTVEPDPFPIPVTTEPSKTLTPPPVMKLYDEVNIVDNNTDLPEPEFKFDDLYDPIPLPTDYKEPIESNEPLIFAQIMPEFPGGLKSLNKWLSNNIKYPEEASKLGLKGKVYIKFVVEKDGSISNVKVLRGIDKIIDNEAIRVISEMPKWNPGFQNGIPVKVAYNIAVSFTLN